jgi:4-carboxymuconolactone decarboxylase
MNKSLYDEGMKIRKEVLGENYLATAMPGADAFNMPLQERVIEYCWGAIWGREGLNRKTRSLINLAMISALNRLHELRADVRRALRNGVSNDEIREALLQVVIYCGVPAGVEAFRIAREVLTAESDTPPA